MLNDDTARQMGTAVKHWVDYQAICGRQMLLSESSLAQPIGEFLSVEHSGRIDAEWNHPNIPNPQRGRPRQIDFALFSRDTDRPVTAIETKWVGDSPVQRQLLLNDVLRLECVRNDVNQGMTRFFLLAGMKEDLGQRCLELGINVGGGREKFFSHLLPLDVGVAQVVPVRGCIEPMRRFFKSFAESYNVDLPTSFRAKPVMDETGEHVRLLVWKISSVRARRTFRVQAAWPGVEVPDTED